MAASSLPHDITRELYWGSDVNDSPVARHIGPLQQFDVLAMRWGHPGWLNNASYKQYLLAQERRNAEQQFTPGTRAYRNALDGIRKAQRQADLDLVRAASKLESDEDDDGPEDEAGEEAASETIAGASTSKRKRAAKKNQASKRPKITAPSLTAEEYQIDWKHAYRLFREGLRAIELENDTYSEYAYRELIPELEFDPISGAQYRFSLRPHQREALGRWIHHTKKRHCFLFADEMGLGKTLVAVARIILVLLEAKKAGKRARFLVVVPLSLMTTWKEELSRCPSIKVLYYHDGRSRTYNKDEIEAYDVVLTTYDIVKNQYAELMQVQLDFRDVQAGHKEIIENVEFERHNNKKGRKPADAWKLRTGRVSCPLLAIEFEEVILDEAHNIKNRVVIKGHALNFVKARSRVCVTGTPIQNGYWDLFSLFRFMRFKPFSQQPFFKLCFIDKSKRRSDSKKRLNRDCELALTAVLAGIRLRRWKSDDFQSEAMTGIKHWHQIKQLITLCPEAQETQMLTVKLWDERYKAHHVGEDDSEDGLANLRELNPEEKKIRIAKERNAMFKKIYEAKANCIHLDLLEARYSETGEAKLEGHSELTQEVKDMIDLVTGNVDPDINVAGGTAQANAEESALSSNTKGFDEKKRGQFEQNRREFMKMISKGKRWMSDKINRIVATIQYVLDSVDRECEMLSSKSERKEHRARSKIIVFGEYVAGLDILEVAIEKVLGEKALHFNGTCSKEQRDKVRKQFEEVDKDMTDPNTMPDDTRILLATSKAAAEGLTLIHARHVMIMAPHWNPYVEDQCIGRAARIGQRSQVIVYRFVMDKSIEIKVCNTAAYKRAQVSGIEDQRHLYQVAPRLQHWSEDRFRQVVSLDSFTFPTSY